jgi:hypothetical protein
VISLTFTEAPFDALFVGVEGTSGGAVEDARVEGSPSLIAGFTPSSSAGTGSRSKVCGSVLVLLVESYVIFKACVVIASSKLLAGNG